MEYFVTCPHTTEHVLQDVGPRLQTVTANNLQPNNKYNDFNESSNFKVYKGGFYCLWIQLFKNCHCSTIYKAQYLMDFSYVMK